MACRIISMIRWPQCSQISAQHKVRVRLRRNPPTKYGSSTAELPNGFPLDIKTQEKYRYRTSSIRYGTLQFLNGTGHSVVPVLLYRSKRVRMIWTQNKTLDSAGSLNPEPNTQSYVHKQKQKNKYVYFNTHGLKSHIFNKASNYRTGDWH